LGQADQISVIEKSDFHWTNGEMMYKRGNRNLSAEFSSLFYVEVSVG
jgi:hypothetical protein